MMETAGVEWLPLMQQPYDDVFGIKSIWDLRTPDGRAVRIERCGQGLNNRLFRVRFNGDVFSCKLFLEDERRRHHREWTALTALDAADADLSPHPLFYAPTGPLPHPTIVCRWVSGATLAGAALSQEEISALVAAMNRLHSVDIKETDVIEAWHQPASPTEYLNRVSDEVAAIRRWVDDMAARSVNLPGFAAELPERLPFIEAAAQLAHDAVRSIDGASNGSPRVLVRADGDLESIVRDDLGRICFIDWDHSGFGDPALDLAELRWHPRSLATEPAYWQVALANYQPRKSDASFVERLRAYDRLVPAAWIARSANLLIDGFNKSTAKRRSAATPSRLYRTVKEQIMHYFVALGVVDAVDSDSSSPD